MKLSKLLLTSTTALGLSMTAAVAGSNEAYLDQTGGGNTASIDQTQADNSIVGQDANDESVAQSGNDNDLKIEQRGDSNVTGSGGRFEQRQNHNEAFILQNGTNNEFVFMDQFGPGASATSNKLRVRQQGDNNIVKEIRQTLTGGTDMNEIDIYQQNSQNMRIGGRVKQTGSGNYMNIYQNGANNTVSPVNADEVLQDGKNNRMDIDQTNTGNLLRRAQQIGDDNTTTANMSGVNNGVADLTVGGASGRSGAVASQMDQFGSNNEADLMITGDDNAYGTLQDGGYNDALNMEITGNENSLGVRQFGYYNEISLATIDGDGSSVGFNQEGDNNFASIDVGRDNHDSFIGQFGDRNETHLEVFGNRNEASLVVTGDNNYLNGYQRGRSHSMEVNIEGNDNNNLGEGAPSFSDAAEDAQDFVTASGKLKSSSFGAGDLFQLDQSPFNQQRNSLVLTGTNADKNSFAMYQNGSKNSINGTISDGSSNQAVVAQIGSFNSASFSQTGSGNNVGIMQ